MTILRAELATEQASRYLVQFCRHAAAMGGRGHQARTHLHGATGSAMQVSAEWSSTQGVVQLGSSGRCTLTADDNNLRLEIAAADEAELSRIQGIVTQDFARFTHRTPTPVSWHRADPPAATDTSAQDQFPPERRSSRRPPVRTALLVLAVLVVVGLHLGLAGTLASRSPWTGRATSLLLALVAVKVAVIGFARLRLHRSRTARARPTEQ